MIIKNIELKKGNYICGCAKDVIGYHYLVAFAFQIEEIEENQIQCILNSYFCDDGRYHLFKENVVIDNLENFMIEDDVYIVSEEIYNEIIDIFQKEDFEEMEIFNHFDTKVLNQAIVHLNQ